MTPTVPVRTRNLPLIAAVVVPLAVVLWAYWSNLAEVASAWSTRADYSHGFLVPLFAGFLLWLKRGRFPSDRVGPSWLGLPLVAAGIGLFLYGGYFNYEYHQPISLLPTVAGLVWTFGGWAVLRWALPSILFLGFMIPLPFRVNDMLAGPLQTLATHSSTFVLQTLGLPALAEGHIIRINDAQIGIVEACSGLRMLVVFFALSTGMVMVVKAPWADKIILVVSSVPIALISNIVRITVTGFLHETVGGETARFFYHDVAGWLMMPLALGLLWLEMKMLAKLFIEVPGVGRANPKTKSRQKTTPAPAPAPRRTRATRPVAPARSPETPAPRANRRPAAPPPPAAPAATKQEPAGAPENADSPTGADASRVSA